MSGHFPRNILLNRITKACITYRPLFKKRYGRHPNQNNMMSVDSEDELYTILQELSGKDICVQVDYDLGNGDTHTGVDILRNVIHIAETTSFIPPTEFYVQKHPIELTELVGGLTNRMDNIRKWKLEGGQT